MKYKLLIVDDDYGFIKSAEAALSAFQIVSATSPETAKYQLSHQVDLVLLDLVFDESQPDNLQGMSLIPYVRDKYPDLPVIVMTNYSSTGKAVEAIKLGAEDFFNKKDLLWSDWVDKIQNYCRTYQKIRNLEQKADRLESLIADSTLIGNSDKIEYLRLKLRDIAENSDDVTLFLNGETGTGKNQAVRYFRKYSRRQKKPYKEFSISELSESLLASELFGHVKGAFTGAHVNKTGLFEAADGGILFLDEIGDCDNQVQSKIMRFIEDKVISPVGSTDTKRLDIQLILATNRDLPAMIKKGEFRADLYQRINRLKIELPPLRERRGDIPLLTEHFFEYFRVKEKTNLDSISPAVMDLLVSYAWPGNVRELQSVIWEACTNARLYNDNVLLIKHLRRDIVTQEATVMTPGIGLGERSVAMELAAIDDALGKAHGNKSEAAELLGLDGDSLRYRIKVKYHQRLKVNLEPYSNIMKYYF